MKKRLVFIAIIFILLIPFLFILKNASREDVQKEINEPIIGNNLTESTDLKTIELPDLLNFTEQLVEETFNLPKNKGSFYLAKDMELTTSQKGCSLGGDKSCISWHYPEATIFSSNEKVQIHIGEYDSGSLTTKEWVSMFLPLKEGYNIEERELQYGGVVFESSEVPSMDFYTAGFYVKCQEKFAVRLNRIYDSKSTEEDKILEIANKLLEFCNN